MDYTPTLIAAFASLLGAALAATVALLVSILSKETKTSELRQQWIDAVRTDIAEFTALVTTVKARVETTEADLSTVTGRIAFYSTYGETVTKASMLEHRLKLRLNPAEHHVLIALLELHTALEGGPDAPEMDEIERKITAEAQRVLKLEWQRVKKGEPAFYWTKRIAILIVLTALGVFAWAAYRAS